MRIFIIVDANELKEDGHGSKVVRGTRWSKYMKIVLVKKYIKIRFFLTKGSTYPPGGWGGVLRIYGFKASVPTFFMDLSPMLAVLGLDNSFGPSYMPFIPSCNKTFFRTVS